MDKENKFIEKKKTKDDKGFELPERRLREHVTRFPVCYISCELVVTEKVDATFLVTFSVSVHIKSSISFHSSV